MFNINLLDLKNTFFSVGCYADNCDGVYNINTDPYKQCGHFVNEVVMSKHLDGRSKLLDAIVSPLGFYVLSLLIVEAFIGSVVVFRNLDTALVYVGIALFVLVIAVVTALVWLKPGHLTFDKSANLEIERMKVDLKHQVSRNANVEAQLVFALIFRTQQRFTEAISCYEHALRIDGANEEALIGRAVAQSYAEPDDLEGPIQALQDILKRYPTNGKALYNLACLRCLVGDERWLDDVRRAISYSPEHRDLARRDKDFEKHWNTPEFLAIIRNE